MTFAELGDAWIGGVRRKPWRDVFYLLEWEEHLWVYQAEKDWRIAPWCPTPEDMVATDWEPIEE